MKQMIPLDPAHASRRSSPLGISRLKVWLFVLLLGCLGAVLAQSEDAPYQDPALSTTERVDDLLARMTLEEKVGQMTQVNVSRLMGGGEWDRGPLNEEWLQVILADHQVGSLLSGGGASPVPNTPESWARMTNDLQRYAIENSRLGIPIVYGIDAVHGHNNVVGATIYPHNIGLAASWNPELAERIAQRTARDVRATGIHWNFAPVTDIGRDPRWGRFYETFGEDPYLASAFVEASVRGYQGDDLAAGVAATVKHFVGYGAPLTGQDRTSALIPLRTLREVHLPSAQAGFEAGAATVMINSGSVNGIPAHASGYLLTDLLRDQLGFEGVAVSDWNDIDKLVNNHRVAATYKDAVELSINAGVDMYMVPHDAATYTRTLLELVQEGRVSEARIDEAVRRVLTLKFELGLFEEPYVDESQADDIVREANRSLAYEAAVSSLTLLENFNTLPLEGAQTILVTGPGADSIIAPMGGWTIGWQGVESPSEVPPGVTVLQGLRERAPEGVTVEHVRGNDPAQLGAALESADVAVVVLSEPPYAEMEGDSDTLRLAVDQEEHLRQVLASGKPTVLVLFAGRPILLPDDIRNSRMAFIMAYLPGSEAGSAIADVIYGNANPSGRLPFTWPSHTGQLPLTYDAPATEVAMREAHYPFGYGLSYTRFQQSALSASVAGEAVDVTVTVSNTGDREGTETVMVFVQRPPSGILTPMRQLVGFTQVTLEPGESEEVSLSIPVSRFSIVTGDILGEGERMVVPGTYRLLVGRLQAQVTLGQP
jgi:beta-glucosidase